MEGSHAAHQTGKAVTVSLKDLTESSVSFETLNAAFGPFSLGILLVKDLPSKFLDLRLRLLSYASYLTDLPPAELEALSCPEAKYLSGWSHGKEALKPGSYDTLKGSYYVNCAFYQGKDVFVKPSPEFPEFTAPNIWPKQSSLPGFEELFKELCTLIIDVAVLVARACDRYAAANIEGYEIGYLERVVKTSTTTKARLLHYFPPVSSGASERTSDGLDHAAPDPLSHDSWCATHVDHGCLTGLTSAVYIDEPAHPLQSIISDSGPKISSLPSLPTLSSPPDPQTGLYIHARDSTITKVSIPHDCLAFQTGEALEVITDGRFKAVPHFVRAVGATEASMNVARNTLAVFTQPDLEQIVDRKRGTTFGAFSRGVVGRFG